MGIKQVFRNFAKDNLYTRDSSQLVWVNLFSVKVSNLIIFSMMILTTINYENMLYRWQLLSKTTWYFGVLLSRYHHLHPHHPRFCGLSKWSLQSNNIGLLIRKKMGISSSTNITYTDTVRISHHFFDNLARFFQMMSNGSGARSTNILLSIIVCFGSSR